MNKRNLSLCLAIAMTVILAACNTTTPDQYFGIAVLNSNLVSGFANRRDFSELQQPSAVLQKDNTVGTATRIQTVETKILILEGALTKVKDLSESEETKPMKDAAIALYEFVLPVYKNEYTELAKKYDAGAKPEELEKDMANIYEKYYKEYDARYNTLMELGKKYAEAHNLNVKWGN